MIVLGDKFASRSFARIVFMIASDDVHSLLTGFESALLQEDESWFWEKFIALVLYNGSL